MTIYPSLKIFLTDSFTFKPLWRSLAPCHPYKHTHTAALYIPSLSLLRVLVLVRLDVGWLDDLEVAVGGRTLTVLRFRLGLLVGWWR